MGDSDAMVAQAVAVTDYPSSVNNASEYNAASSDAAAINDSSAAEAPAKITASSAISTDGTYAATTTATTTTTTTDVSNLGDGSAYSMDPNSVMQEAPVTATYDNKPTAKVADVDENLARQEKTVLESAQAAVYDSTINENGSVDISNFPTLAHEMNGIASNDAAGAAVEQQFQEGTAFSTEEERLWSIVRANSLDFNAWTALIEETEKVAEGNIFKIRKTYDAFLAEFPLCYGYWKKYADHEARLSSIEKVVEVYERAVEAVTYSVDIWLHYCMFAISTYGDPDTVRRLFERGLAYVGTDYLSYPLWDKYIEYEYSQQEWCRLAMIYTRILESPNQQLDRYFGSFKELAASRPLSELQTAEEATAMVASNSGTSEQSIEGEVNPDGIDHSAKSENAGLIGGDELEKYVAIREEMYRKSKEFDSKIIGFETAIRRPYFHVRALNVSELENWHNYLDFIEREGDLNKSVG